MAVIRWRALSLPKGSALRKPGMQWACVALAVTTSFWKMSACHKATCLTVGDDAKSSAVGLSKCLVYAHCRAVYLGVAKAAVAAAAEFARNRVPTALGRPIATVENIQRHMGQAQFLVQQAQAQLYHTAQLWDQYPQQRITLGSWVNVAKVTATNNAIEAVDQCMRVVGGSSLLRETANRTLLSQRTRWAKPPGER